MICSTCTIYANCAELGYKDFMHKTSGDPYCWICVLSCVNNHRPVAVNSWHGTAPTGGRCGKFVDLVLKTSVKNIRDNNLFALVMVQSLSNICRFVYERLVVLDALQLVSLPSWNLFCILFCLSTIRYHLADLIYHSSQVTIKLQHYTVQYNPLLCWIKTYLFQDALHVIMFLKLSYKFYKFCMFIIIIIAIITQKVASQLSY